MEDGAITIHEDHCGGEIKETCSQGQDIVGNEVRLANKQAVHIEVKTTRRNHN